MTSNLGSPLIKEFSQDYETMDREVKKILESHFRPEFLNRIDEVIIFRPLTRDSILKIVDLQINLLRKRLEERKIGVEISRKAKESLAAKGYDPVYGARPLKRIIQQEIQNPLAMKILSGGYKEGDTATIDVDAKNEFVFSKK
jgi:ATP-dependent Clp protease ATP-binding subunit ClpB